MSEEKKIPRWIAIAASITTLSIPFFYLFGYAYDQGYLHAYGISNEFFSRTPQEYLVFSFYACLNIAISTSDFFQAKALLIGVLAIFIGSMTMIMIIAHKKQADEKFSLWSAKIREHRLFDYCFFPGMIALFAFVTPILLILLISIFLLVPAAAYFKGENVAKNEITNALPCPHSDIPSDGCVSFIENGKLIASGRFVARSTTHLAIFNQGKTTIYPVKDQIVVVAPL